MNERSAMHPESAAGFFVYGTLKRGQCRERVWPSEPQAVHSAWIGGCLYGRHDYPALIIPVAESLHHRVLGQFWTFPRDQMASIAAVLDEVEGTSGNRPDDLYHRHLVPVYGLDDAAMGWAITYVYNRDLSSDGFVLVPPSSGTQAWPTNDA